MNGTREAGGYDVRWHGRNDRGDPVPSGIYFYRLEADGMAYTRQVVLLK